VAEGAEEAASPASEQSQGAWKRTKTRLRALSAALVSCRGAAGADDPLDLVHGVVLSVDRQNRRILCEVDRVDGSLHFGRNADRLTVGIHCAGAERIIVVRPKLAVVAAAVPSEILITRIDREGAGIGGLVGRILDRDGGVAGLVTLRVQEALPLLSGAVEPSTTTVEPT